MNYETALIFFPTINDEPDINAALLIKEDYEIKQCNASSSGSGNQINYPNFIKSDEISSKTYTSETDF